MNLRGLSSVTDFFVVCSGDSDMQVKAIADEVQEGLKKKGVAPWQVEGGSPNWVIVDFVDVVVHVFHKQTRPFYNLERLWGDAKIQHVVDEGVPLPRPRKRTATTRPRKATARKSRELTQESRVMKVFLRSALLDAAGALNLAPSRTSPLNGPARRGTAI